jgi:hypothetical protein
MSLISRKREGVNCDCMQSNCPYCGSHDEEFLNINDRFIHKINWEKKKEGKVVKKMRKNK